MTIKRKGNTLVINVEGTPDMDWIRSNRKRKKLLGKKPGKTPPEFDVKEK